MLHASARDTAPGTTRIVVADGVRVHTEAWSPPDAAPGRRVLLLHGLGAHTLSWEPMAGPLAKRLRATVIALDFVGFGRTRAPERSSSLETQRQVLGALLREEYGPALLVGNSMGATIGIGVAAAHPEVVTGLVMLNPAVPHPRPGLADWLRFAWLAPLAVPAVGTGVVAWRSRTLGAERLVDASLQASLTQAHQLDPDLRRRMVQLTAERLRWPEAPGAYAGAARSLVRYLAWGLHRDLGRAARLRPTLLIHGSEDRLVAVEAARHAARLHPIDLRVLDGRGHAPQLEDPGLIIDEIETWLDGPRFTDGRMGAWQASSTSQSGRSSPTSGTS
ncbi:MAG TPA: alpha/beta hydrolase [Acidimicrobiia bacterium]|nr:alpha/beta hydrolase [Acidimicrobiia bacterium]